MLPMIMQGISALAGAMGNQAGASRSMQLAAPSASELAGEAAVTKYLPQMGQLTDLGPGANEVKANMGTQKDLAAMLQSYSQGGFLPGQADFATANQFATSAFQPQQVAINQQFQDEQLKANQMAARMGRSPNDPLIQAKLSQERQRAQERLGASQSAYVSEFAQRLPTQRLGYMGQLADLRSGLASQAMANRHALVSMGSQIENAGRNFRMGTATQSQQQQQGGGLGGALKGFMAMSNGADGKNPFANLFNNPTSNAGTSTLGMPDLNKMYSPSTFNFGGSASTGTAAPTSSWGNSGGIPAALLPSAQTSPFNINQFLNQASYFGGQ